MRPNRRRHGGRLSGWHVGAVGPGLRVAHVRRVRVPDGHAAAASVPQLGLRQMQQRDHRPADVRTGPAAVGRPHAVRHAVRRQRGRQASRALRPGRGVRRDGRQVSERDPR